MKQYAFTPFKWNFDDILDSYITVLTTKTLQIVYSLLDIVFKLIQKSPKKTKTTSSQKSICGS